MNKKVLVNPNNQHERVTVCGLEHAKFLKMLGWKEVEVQVTPAKTEAKRP